MIHKRFFILRNLKDWVLLEEHLTSMATEKKDNFLYILISFVTIDLSYHKRLDLSLFDYFLASSKYKILGPKNWKKELEVAFNYSVSNQEIVFLS